MSTNLAILEAQVKQLSVVDREQLLRQLIVSIEADTQIENSWLAEAQIRDQEIESGVVSPLDGTEALARLRAEFR
jgi:Putative addiction module component